MVHTLYLSLITSLSQQSFYSSYYYRHSPSTIQSRLRDFPKIHLYPKLTHHSLYNLTNLYPSALSLSFPNYYSTLHQLNLHLLKIPLPPSLSPYHTIISQINSSSDCRSNVISHVYPFDPYYLSSSPY